MKRSIGSLLLLTLGATTLWAMDANRVILRVNDRIATLYDYEVRRNERLRAIQQADLDPARRAELTAQLGAEVLGNILDELLVLSRADQIGFVPSEDEVDIAVDRAKQSFGIQNEEQFQQALESSGMTAEGFRKQVEVNLRVSQVMAREVQQRVLLDEEDLRRYYYENEQEFTTPERLRLQEIVVLETSSLAAEERVALAQELVESLEAGEAMADLASQHRDEGTTSGLVELGWIQKGDLDAALEQAVWNLAAGGTSAPVDGRGGLHLLQVLEREEAAVLPFQDVINEIDSRERNRLLSEEYESYLVELRDAAYIRAASLPEDAEGFRVQESASRISFEVDQADLLVPDDEP